MGKKLDAYRAEEVNDWHRAIQRGLHIYDNDALVELFLKRLGYSVDPGHLENTHADIRRDYLNRLEREKQNLTPAKHPLSKNSENPA